MGTKIALMEQTRKRSVLIAEGNFVTARTVMAKSDVRNNVMEVNQTAQMGLTRKIVFEMNICTN